MSSGGLRTESESAEYLFYTGYESYIFDFLRHYLYTLLAFRCFLNPILTCIIHKKGDFVLYL